jgi:hypothetical protein
MPDDLARAHNASSPPEAELVRALLEDAGILAVIPDRNIPMPGVDLTPFDEGGVVGCDVMVTAGDLERARQVIEEARESGRMMTADVEGEEEE